MLLKDVENLNSFNPELQVKDTKSAIESKLIELLFKKIGSEDKTKYDNFYSSSKAEIIINENDIDDVFKSIYTTIIRNRQKSLRKGSGWIIVSVINHTISISKCNPLAGSSYI